MTSQSASNSDEEEYDCLFFLREGERDKREQRGNRKTTNTKNDILNIFSEHLNDTLKGEPLGNIISSTEHLPEFSS